MIEQHCEADLAARGRLADREALGEVVEADPDRDEQREAVAPSDMPRGHVGRCRARATAAAPGPMLTGSRADVVHPALVVDEAEQADAEAHQEHGGAADELAPRAAALDGDCSSAASTGSMLFDSVSTSRNTSTPVAMALNSAIVFDDRLRMRPTGNPRKIVRPAIAPRSRISPSTSFPRAEARQVRVA